MNFDSSITQMLNSYPDTMPQIDKLREILQQTALLGLARHKFFQHAVFYGGAALRILYGLDRYSENLDFSLLKPDLNFDFTPFLHGMNQELMAMGFELDVDLRKKNTDTGIWLGRLHYIGYFDLCPGIQIRYFFSVCFFFIQLSRNLCKIS
ncbi:MAG: nucleotidyl transferase AbiEii/AbiGii toxin family protein [Parachlamydiaceae bacterium]|nr:nucleotidyl transferase AbiEii/AbiGii toxin family protein [Parachlamydiaceae bacterium]